MHVTYRCWFQNCSVQRAVWVGGGGKPPPHPLFYCSFVQCKCFSIAPSVADTGSGAFLTPGPGSGIWNRFFSGSRIPNPYFLELSDKFLGKKFYNSLKTGPNFFLWNLWLHKRYDNIEPNLLLDTYRTYFLIHQIEAYNIIDCDCEFKSKTLSLTRTHSPFRGFHLMCWCSVASNSIFFWRRE
jgi:hypothetical protein